MATKQHSNMGGITGEQSFITRGYLFAFILVTSLFFMWGIANALNDILVRQFQKALDLSRGQAGFIAFAFYIGYFVMALPAGSAIKRFGYKNGILFGLFLYMTGALLFYPAAEMRSYLFFLSALFVIASGLCFLETAANPFITVMGGADKGPQRLNLAQSFNAVAVALTPLMGGIFIFSGIELSAEEIASMDATALDTWRAAEARMVQVPYLVLAGVVALVALLIAITKMPHITPQSAVQGDGKHATVRELLASPHLWPAVIAQLFYVGAQVCIWSYFINYAIEVMPGTTEKAASKYLSLSLCFFMVGRFLGTLLMLFIAPARLLTIYAAICVGLCVAAIALDGMPAVIALGLTALFMSIMFPTIFALGVRDLGRNTELGSSLIIMAIVGGAIIPLGMGYLSDETSVQYAVLVPMICLVAVFVFGFYETRKLARR